MSMSRAKLVPIGVWAANTIANHTGKAPHPNTLRRWANDGKISPPATRVGKNFYVREDARYVDVQAERLERMISGS
ncbi:excisionase [Robbsia andropogonis]|uniref:excisionase n=1 Tax=Robbsia andropogonis TaxID=28092 RepID=UPI0004672F20|nr:excisionase [Robbsia andropogonis]